MGNLANRKNYSFTSDEVERLFAPIEHELKEVRALFNADAASRRKVDFGDE